MPIGWRICYALVSSCLCRKWTGFISFFKSIWRGYYHTIVGLMFGSLVLSLEPSYFSCKQLQNLLLVHGNTR
jgi:hypothetical protein